jgi:hydrophobe/amphiphile efflux-1 (HAE1) family protein
MISHFFIDRPIFASVLSIVITLAGAIAVFTLPVAQYPEITPPTVQVAASYPGANAKIVEDTVAAPIEQQVNGVENMLYMSSQCTNDGNYNLTVTFKLGTDLNMAQVLVQNRVALSLPVLPQLVQRQGVSVKKKSPNTMMIVNLISDLDPRTNRPIYDDLYLSNYATIQIKDELARLPGVGDVTFMGQRDYSMRVWLDPEKLATRNLTAVDVITAVSEQNVQVAAGQIGAQPAPASQAFQLTISTLGRLVDVEQFADIILKTGQSSSPHLDMNVVDPNVAGVAPSLSNKDTLDASVVRLRDVARIERGAQQYDQSCTLNGKPSVALSIFQLPGSNAIQTANNIYEKMQELNRRFPDGLKYAIVYDTTPFINESIREVFHTLRDAVILVALVVLVFLQSWRATLIPLVAVPVAIVGTFAVMAALGFSLNNLTLFGLVLAIGIVVDDAIVVVENVERWLEHGLEPKEAARRAMDEVTGPVIAVGLVLCAVFVPCAFLAGITGQFFRQFAVTIAVSTALSAFNSLTLSPALAGILLQPRGAKRDPVTRTLDFSLGWFFKAFNWSFDWSTAIYTRMVGGMVRVSLLVLVVYAGLLVLTYWSFSQVPTGFIPEQDKGYLLVNVQLPDSAAVTRTQRVMNEVEKIARDTKGVKSTLGIAGQSLLLNANASNFGSMYVMLDRFDRRRGRSAEAIVQELRGKLREQIREARISVFGAPPVEGLGNVGGFKMVIEDRGGAGLKALQKTAEKMVDEARATGNLQGLFTGSRVDTPWLYLEIDRTKCMSLGVSLADLFMGLQVYLGSYYVNNFNEFGRSWQVNLQADTRFRYRLDELKQIKIRNNKGQMVPLPTLAEMRDTSGPVMMLRYNMYPAATINGRPVPGISSGQAAQMMEKIAADTLPSAMASDWTELTFLQQQAGNSAMGVFALAVVFVFLVLAAQYESWSLPLAVILVVPMCLLCSIAGVAMAALDVNIFTQIGFVVLVGLASKNAILIVEFAKQQREAGVDLRKATLEACRLRLRPILMTSFAFILGVVPLVISHGAGAEMRRALGSAVFAGMLGVTLFGVFLTPVFYYVIERIGDLRETESKKEA